MKTKQISFFSTDDELRNIFESVSIDIDFCVTKIDGSEFPATHESISSVLNFCIAQHGDENFEDSYLLSPCGESVTVRKLVTKSGHTRFILDQALNPRSVFVRPGGVLANKNAIIAGKIGTISDDEWSLKLLSEFKRSVKNNFKKHKSFFVSAESERMLKSGFRLTQSIRAPTEFDLKI